MKAPEMARKIGSVLDSLEALAEAELAGGGESSAGLDLARARIAAERELVALHGADHVCADPSMPWLATPYESEDSAPEGAVGSVDAGAGSEPCWTLRWLARAHQVIGMPTQSRAAAMPAGVRVGTAGSTPFFGE